jgi:hypothetical protein
MEARLFCHLHQRDWPTSPSSGQVSVTLSQWREVPACHSMAALGTPEIPDMACVAIIGGSRGIGEAVARHLVAKSERVLSVSRSVSQYGEWIKADVSTPEGVNTVAEAAGAPTVR